jgi:hypothetical protein
MIQWVGEFVTSRAFARRAVSQDHTTLVIAVDLTQSMAVRGPDNKTEFEKNIDAVTKLLAQAPADSRVTVIGITDRSFAQPDILLSAAIPPDPGYFGERLQSAQLQLVRTWKIRTAKLVPTFRQTDIFGALMLAGDIFDQCPSVKRKLLVIFSDMRQQTPDLDIESPSRVPSLPRVGKRASIRVVDLRKVEVYALGVDGAGKSITYWQSLRQFWAEYFRQAGTDLRGFSVIRDLTQMSSQ